MTNVLLENDQRARTIRLIQWSGFLALGAFGAAYAVLTRSFAQLHLFFPVQHIPVFVGEFLLAYSLFLCVLLIREKRPKFEQWHVVLFGYAVWLLFKTTWGLFFYAPGSVSPLALRNAALFYYPLFAVIGFFFYRSDFFKPKQLMFYLGAVLFTKFVCSINNYFVYPYLVMGLVCLLGMNKKGWWWLLLIPVLVVPTYYFDPKTFTTLDFFFQGGRSRVVGHLGAFIFLTIAAVKIYLPKGKIQKAVVLILAGVLLVFAIGRFADKNSVKSMISLQQGWKLYQEYKTRIDEEGKNYVPRPLRAQIYSEEEMDLAQNVSVFIKTEYSKKSQEIKNKKKNLEDVSVAIEKNRLKAFDEKAAEMEKKKQELISKVDSDLTKEKEQKIQAAKREIPAAVPSSTAKIQEIEKKYDQLKQEKIDQINRATESEKTNYADMLSQKKILDLKTVIAQNGMEKTVTVSQLLNKMEDDDGTGSRTLDVAYSNIFFRVFIWEDMIREIIKKKAFLGVSFGEPQRSRSLETLGWASREWIRDGWITPHNSYLHMIYRGGLGGVFLVFMMFYLWSKLVRLFSEKRSLSGLMLCSLLVYWLTMGNFLVFFELPYNAIPFWSVFGLTLGYARSLKEKKYLPPPVPNQFAYGKLHEKELV